MNNLKSEILAALLPNRKYWNEDGTPRLNELTYAASLERESLWIDRVYFPVFFRYTRIFYGLTAPENRWKIFGTVQTDLWGEQFEIIDDDLLIEFQFRMDKYDGWKRSEQYPEWFHITDGDIKESGILPNGIQMRMF